MIEHKQGQNAEQEHSKTVTFMEERREAASVCQLALDKKMKYQILMTAVTLKAHFDGEKICLDEPFELKPNTPLIIADPGPDQDGDERVDWIAIAKKAWDEPDYPSDLIQEKPAK